MKLGFFELLGLAFIILKLTGYIDWHWVLVILPIFAKPILYLGGIIIGLVWFAFTITIQSIIQWYKSLKR